MEFAHIIKLPNHENEYHNIKNLVKHIMDFSHYIIKSSQYIIHMLHYIKRTICKQDIMAMANQMFLFVIIRQFWRFMDKIINNLNELKRMSTR